MPSPVSTIRNLGAASDKAFARAGVHSAEKLREIGADKAYELLLRSGTRPHFIGYYAMVMGLQGRRWNDCAGAEKKMLRERFDKIVSDARSPSSDGSGLPSGMANTLDRIGVRSNFE